MKKLLTLVSLTTLLLTACAQTPETKPTEQNDTTATQQLPPTEYNMAAVQEHNTKETCWSVVDGKIYDLTEWIGKHPGGPGNIMKICGSDGTSAFKAQHGDGAKFEKILSKYYMGLLVE